MSREYKTVEAAKRSRFLCPRKNQPESVGLSATLTIPELLQIVVSPCSSKASQSYRVGGFDCR
jgi:hypothetical protein